MAKLWTPVFLFLAFFMVAQTTWANVENQRPLILVFFDLESPFEADTWIREFGLSTQGCAPGFQYCNSYFQAVRPTSLEDFRDMDGEDLVDWLQERQIRPDALFVTGHHAGGFFGKKGSFVLNQLGDAFQKIPCSEFFCKIRFVYLGGCYTTESKFLAREMSPVGYLSRVLTHREETSLDLVQQAVHQIANSNNPTPWGVAFPNSPLFGFGEVGPGDNSKEGIARLIHGFLNEMKNTSQTQNASMALYRFIENAKIHGSHNPLSLAAVRWWNTIGKRQSQTSAAASPAMSNVEITTIEAAASENTIDPHQLDTFIYLLTVLIGMDVQKFPWLKGVTPIQSQALVRDIFSALNNLVGRDGKLPSNAQESISELLQRFASEIRDQKQLMEMLRHTSNLWVSMPVSLQYEALQAALNLPTGMDLQIANLNQKVGIRENEVKHLIIKKIKEEIQEGNLAFYGSSGPDRLLEGFKASGDSSKDHEVANALYDLGDLLTSDRKTHFSSSAILTGILKALEAVLPLSKRDALRIGRWLAIPNNNTRSSVVSYFLRNSTSETPILRAIARTLSKEFQTNRDYDDRPHLNALRVLFQSNSQDTEVLWRMGCALSENNLSRQILDSIFQFFERNPPTDPIVQFGICSSTVVGVDEKVRSRTLRLVSRMEIKYKMVEAQCQGKYTDDPDFKAFARPFFDSLSKTIVDW